jgi:hypothetical protein
MGDVKMSTMPGNDVAVKFRLRGPDDEPLLEVAEFTSTLQKTLKTDPAGTLKRPCGGTF